MYIFPVVESTIPHITYMDVACICTVCTMPSYYVGIQSVHVCMLVYGGDEYGCSDVCVCLSLCVYVTPRDQETRSDPG